jgi:D-alanyl-D-alanine carboxypeptidase
MGLGSFAGALSAFDVSAVQAASGSPPACRYADVLDTTFMIPRSYVPPALVSTSNAGLNGGGAVRKFVVPDLAAMAKAARNAGAGLRVISGYRSYAYQQQLYQREVDKYGKTVAEHSVARPGHSEHQLGVTIDFGSAKTTGDVSQSFAYTAAGRWMKQNSWKYGWIMSYPKGETSKTCYYYEPWHFRYVGRDLAARVHQSGLTLREYLWRHFE